MFTMPLMDRVDAIDPKSKQIIESYEFSAFGEELPKGLPIPSNPWRYASKRTDPEFHLINFGKRYYDPQISRWLTTDPAGFVDGTNLYVYLRNNPFRYIDPDGQFAMVLFMLPILEWGSVAGPTWMLPSLTTTGIIAALLWGGHEAYTYLESRGEPPRSDARSQDGPRGGHSTNVRESNRGKHERADARRQREQRKAEERRENSKRKR